MMKLTITALALLAVAVAAYEHEDYHSHPSYKYEYGVKDPHTGDHKSQWEHRDGDITIAALALLAVAVAAYEHEDYHSYPSYKFEYGVKDPHTGDHKSHIEVNHSNMMKITIAALALLAVAVAAYEHEDYHSHPSYKFEYGVKDPHTGDHKSQWEHRDGDVVKGAYTLHEADGTERVVEYTSDKHNGFQAHVKRVGHAHHPEVYGHQEAGHSNLPNMMKITIAALALLAVAVAAYEHEDYHSLNDSS
uniref:Uncharacterized protein n=1 Tax=Anopheles arabiensis TaxID=7173 RepID=A0A182I6I3_ANOAR